MPQPGQSGAAVAEGIRVADRLLRGSYAEADGFEVHPGEAVVRAAAPIIRAEVVADVVRWLHGRASQGQRNPVCARIAADLQRDFAAG